VFLFIPKVEASLQAPTQYHPRQLPAREDFHVYLAIGQSNMAGQGTFEDRDLFAIPNALLFNGNNWETAQADHENLRYGLNRYNNHNDGQIWNYLSPAFYFAHHMQANSPGKTIGIISNARGGTALWEWMPGTVLYENTVRMVKDAIAQGGTLRGIIWHQGESDLADFDDLSYYITSLNLLIDSLRRDLGVTAENCPFIAGEIQHENHPVYGSRDTKEFNALLHRFVSTERNTDFISAHGLPGRPDGDTIHFNSHSQRMLGRRYAEKMLEMQPPQPRGEYIDVNHNQWFYNDVNFVTDNALFFGTHADEFEPEVQMTEAMAITVLARYSGIDTHHGTTWYSNAVGWGKANGLVTGEGLDNNITREQLVTILWRLSGEPPSTGQLWFTDSHRISSSSVRAMRWAVETGILVGFENEINPRDGATRAEVASIIQRYVNMNNGD
jgi:hypothetical protein